MADVVAHALAAPEPLGGRLAMAEFVGLVVGESDPDAEDVDERHSDADDAADAVARAVREMDPVAEPVLEGDVDRDAVAVSDDVSVDVLVTDGVADTLSVRDGTVVRVAVETSELVLALVADAEGDGECEGLPDWDRMDAVADVEPERVPEPVAEGEGVKDGLPEDVDVTDGEVETVGVTDAVTVTLELAVVVLDTEMDCVRDGEPEFVELAERLRMPDTDACRERCADCVDEALKEPVLVTVAETDRVGEPQCDTVGDSEVDAVAVPDGVDDSVSVFVAVDVPESVDVSVKVGDAEPLEARDALAVPEPPVDAVFVPVCVSVSDGDADALLAKDAVPLRVVESLGLGEMDGEPVPDADALPVAEYVTDDEPLAEMVEELEWDMKLADALPDAEPEPLCDGDGVRVAVADCVAGCVTVPVAAPEGDDVALTLDDADAAADMEADPEVVAVSEGERDDLREPELAALAVEQPEMDDEPEVVGVAEELRDAADDADDDAETLCVRVTEPVCVVLVVAELDSDDTLDAEPVRLVVVVAVSDGGIVCDVLATPDAVAEGDVHADGVRDDVREPVGDDEGDPELLGERDAE